MRKDGKETEANVAIRSPNSNLVTNKVVQFVLDIEQVKVHAKSSGNKYTDWVNLFLSQAKKPPI
ncbi:hypothetical protein GCM10027185_36340 [Spirosoma pulveris]